VAGDSHRQEQSEEQPLQLRIKSSFTQGEAFPYKTHL